MENIILQAMKNCAQRYSKGFPRWEHLWDEKLTIDAKAKEIATELENMGYTLTR